MRLKHSPAARVVVLHWAIWLGRRCKAHHRIFDELRAHSEIGRAEAFRISMKQLRRARGDRGEGATVSLYRGGLRSAQSGKMMAASSARYAKTSRIKDALEEAAFKQEERDELLGKK
jgi:hypothetical protein